MGAEALDEGEMGTPPASNPNLDGTRSQVINICLGTPLVIREILEKFANCELLQLSRVNKQWNYEVRCVLRDRGTLTARIKSSNPGCQDLVAFASHLTNMPVVPFSGIHLVLSHNVACQSVLNGSLDPSYKVILERLPCKNLSVEFRDSWTKSRHCPAVVFVQRLLDDFCGVLETLSLTMDWQLTFFFEHLFQNRTFPRLKTLKLDMHYTAFPSLAGSDFKGFVKKFVSSAPNLKELQIPLDAEFDENVLEGSLAVLAPLAPSL